MTHLTTRRSLFQTAVALLLALCLAVGLLCLPGTGVLVASAASDAADRWEGNVAKGFGGGKGTQAEPYLIGTGAQLAYLSQQVNSGTSYSGQYFALTGDIDLCGIEWTPIGKGILSNEAIPDPAGYSCVFRGHFEGNSHIIYNLCITQNGTSYAGLFGVVAGGSVRGLGLEGVRVRASAGAGYRSLAGGLAGALFGGTLEQCYVTDADIQNDTVNYPSATAGLVGLCGGAPSAITDCYAQGNVRGNGQLALLLGANYVGTPRMTNCYGAGSLTLGGSSLGGTGAVGAMIGYNDGAATLEDCFFDGSIQEALTGESGTLLGRRGSATVTNCYFSCTSLTDAKQGMTAEPEDLCDPDWIETHLGWDMDTVWELLPGADYPTLRGRVVAERPESTPHTHSYTVTSSTPAGCATQGETVLSCACGETQRQAIPPTGHDFSLPEVIEAADVARGYVTVTCQNGCGATQRRSLLRLVVDRVEAEAGATVTVTVDLQGNPGILGAVLTVSYDPALTLLRAEGGSALSSLTMTRPATMDSPCSFVWDGVSVADSQEGTVLALTFVLPENGEVGQSYAIGVTAAPGNLVGADLAPLAVTVEEGAITVARSVGDANADGVVDVADVIVLRRYLAGGYGVTVDTAAGDMDGDGTITVADIVLLRRMLVGE